MNSIDNDDVGSMTSFSLITAMNDQDEQGIGPLRVVETNTNTNTANKFVVDDDETSEATIGRNQYALARFKAVRTRPSTVAANEFFSDGGTRDVDSLPRRLDRLTQVLVKWDSENGSPDLSCSFSSDPKESRRQAMTAAVMARADPTFLQAFRKWFKCSLQRRQRKVLDGEEDEDDDDDTKQQQEEKESAGDDNYDDGGGDNTRRTTPTSISKDDEEATFFRNLRLLGWIRSSGMLQQPLTEALHQTILAWVKNTISKEFEVEGLFQQVLEYKTRVVLPWLEDLLGAEALEGDGWPSRMNFAVSECYCLVRMQEIFELVAEYPDSHPAVLELRDVLDVTRMHHATARALKKALIRRLNHPGANTSQIIDVYINTIKVFREIDPSDRLLQVVAEPVRSYLRQRQNTVRCIITSLTDAEVGGDLYEELRRQDLRPLEHVKADSDDEDEPPDMDWLPPPPLNKERGNFLGSGNRGGGGDILSMLVSIYGSKDLFVNEFRLMLADKLLANLTFDTDQEVHTLELLKLRFGEASMRNCEIMIKDIGDSKRVTSNIHNTIKAKQRAAATVDTAEPADPRVDAAMVSHIFWPTLQNEHFKHNPRIQAQLDEFSSEYGRLKNPRRLVWLNQLGTVQLELDVLEEKEDGTVAVETREFSVSPLLTTLISHFEDKDQWTAEELSNETGLAEHIIQKRMAYWVNNRVIRLVPGPSVLYEVATREHLLQGGNDPEHAVASMMDDDGGEGQAVSVLAQEQEEMEVFESYIVGMLTNLGQLPLGRIHNMLKMYVSGGSDVKYSKTPQQLSMFLLQLCKQEKLECGPDGMYKLVKK